jgi:hypothetical protein
MIDLEKIQNSRNLKYYQIEKNRYYKLLEFLWHNNKELELYNFCKNENITYRERIFELLHENILFYKELNFLKKKLKNWPKLLNIKWIMSDINQKNKELWDILYDNYNNMAQDNKKIEKENSLINLNLMSYSK